MHSFDRLIPATLQLAKNQPVLWIGSIVLSLRLLRGVSRRLQITLQGGERIAVLLLLFFAGHQSGFDGGRLHISQHLFPDHVIHRNPSERNAARVSVIEPAAIACIA